MRLEQATTTIILLLVSSPVNSFTPACCRHHLSSRSTAAIAAPFNNNNNVVLYSTAADDFLKKQQEAAVNSAAAAAEEEPQLFTDEMLKDMQRCLLTIDRRVKEGPGCLDNQDVDEFAMAAGRILVDMKAQAKELPDRIRPGERQARANAVAAEAAKAADEEGKSPEEIEAIAKAAFDAATDAMIPPPVVAEAAAAAEDTTTSPPPTPESPSQPVVNIDELVEDSDEDGPAYDGTGGLGLAKGTANTYEIDGMDEMTADEYQAALTQAVIDRAKTRRDGMGGRHGNQQTNDYMASLNSKGDHVNVFNKKKDENDDVEQPGRYEKQLQETDYMAALTTNKGGDDDDDDDCE